MKVMLIDTPDDPVRLAFPFLFTKREGMSNQDGTKGKDTFQANFIIAPNGANAKRVKDAIAAVAKEKYGDNWAEEYAEWGDDQKGLRKGNLKKNSQSNEVYDGFADNLYIAPSNTVRPGVFNRKAVPVAEGDEGAPYGGCYVNAEVDVWALKKQGVKKRICSDLLGVQFTRDGDAFGSGAAPSKADAFASLSVADDGEDKPKADPFG